MNARSLRSLRPPLSRSDHRTRALALLEWGSVVVMIITIICVWTPFAPFLPPVTDRSLDWSWHFGVNQALTEGLRFGTDIIFTFGPYAAVYTSAYSPSADASILVACLLLAGSQSFCIQLSTRRPSWWVHLLIAVIFVGFIQTRDVLLYSYPLTMTVAVAARGARRIDETAKPSLGPFALAAICVPLAILSLVKGTMIVICVATVLFNASFLWFNERRTNALIVLIVPVLATVGWWLIARQPLGSFLDYYRQMVPIMSGYVEAMAVADTGRFAVLLQISAYLFGAVLILIVIIRAASFSISARVLLLSLFGICFFLSFKGAFIRHDAHAWIASNILLVATACVLLHDKQRIALMTLVFGFAFWFYLTGRFVENWSTPVLSQTRATYSSAFRGLHERLVDRNWPAADYGRRVAQIRAEFPLPKLSGTSDIYSYRQLELLASDNRWAPRPVFQSYSAYTASLIDLNRRHLLSATAPDNIFLRIEPIDGRLPSLEDGASWPLLVTNYRAVGMTRGFLQLRHSASSGEMIKPLSTAHRQLGETYDLPFTTDVRMLARIDLSLSPTGQALALFYKPGELEISLNMMDGKVNKFRLIAGMASSNFLVSPLIEDTTEYSMLYGHLQELAAKQVKSIRVEAVGFGSRFWNADYLITFSTF